ncbi:MAG: RNA polymerase sigma factor [Sciscionella sp.]
MNGASDIATVGPTPGPVCGAELQYRLRADGPVYEDAVRELHALMLRAARHQAAHTPGVYTRLGAARVEHAVAAAADEASMAVLARLDTFEGRSRFTTWAYKFGILHAAVELRRAAWQHVEIDLAALSEPVSALTTPEQHAFGSDLAQAVAAAIDDELTAHQRAIIIAVLVENVPIDVLAERLGTNRNALYKALHDARTRLRTALARRGYLTEHGPAEEVIS